MIITPQQRNVRAALHQVLHQLDGGDETVVFVTRGYSDPTLSCMVVAVDPDGTVSGWRISHSWTQEGPGWQTLHAEPSHYDLAEQWMATWLSGEGGANCPMGRVREAFKWGSLVVRRTEGRPTWHVMAVTRMNADYVNRDVYDAPHALVVGLNAVYGPDIPSQTVTPGGRRHGE